MTSEPGPTPTRGHARSVARGLFTVGPAFGAFMSLYGRNHVRAERAGR
jgi:hypothetical protein